MHREAITLRRWLAIIIYRVRDYSRNERGSAAESAKSGFTILLAHLAGIFNRVFERHCPEDSPAVDRKPAVFIDDRQKDYQCLPVFKKKGAIHA